MISVAPMCTEIGWAWRGRRCLGIDRIHQAVTIAMASTAKAHRTLRQWRHRTQNALCGHRIAGGDQDRRVAELDDHEEPRSARPVAQSDAGAEAVAQCAHNGKAKAAPLRSAASR